MQLFTIDSTKSLKVKAFFSFTTTLILKCETFNWNEDIEISTIKSYNILVEHNKRLLSMM